MPSVEKLLGWLNFVIQCRHYTTDHFLNFRARSKGFLHLIFLFWKFVSALIKKDGLKIERFSLLVDLEISFYGTSGRFVRLSKLSNSFFCRLERS